MEKNQVGKVFKDVRKNGKDNKWRERKLDNLELGVRLEKLGYKNFMRVNQCAEVLKFLEQPDNSLKLYQTYFCKNKLCPICNWRRSMKYSAQASQIIDKAIEREPKGEFLFLTLTVKNVDGLFLNSELSRMTEGFRRLFLYKKVKKNMIGFLRSTEVTYNSENKNYHPHLHILIFVKSSYFTGNGSNYISQKEWGELWGKALKEDYVPQVDIRKVKPKIMTENSFKDVRGAILETAKYPMKPINILGQSEDEKLQITEDLIQGLHRKRQIAFGGLFKKIRKELQLSDIEDGDLIHVTDEKESTKGKELIAVWNWERKNYFIK